MSTSTEGKAGFHHGDLRRVLVDTAGEMVAENGSAGLSLREVARRAQVSHNAPYRHFANREELLAAVAEAGFQQLTAEMAAAAGGLRGLGAAYVCFARTHPGLFHLMFGAEIQLSDHPATMAAARASYALLQQATAPGPEARFRSLGAWALVHGLAQLLLDDKLAADLTGELSDQDLFDRICTALGISA